MARLPSRRPIHAWQSDSGRYCGCVAQVWGGKELSRSAQAGCFSRFAPRIGRFARLCAYSFVRVRDQCKAMEQTASVSLWISLAVADGTGWQKMRGVWGDCGMTASLAVHSKRTWQDLRVFLKLQALGVVFIVVTVFSLLSLWVGVGTNMAENN